MATNGAHLQLDLTLDEDKLKEAAIKVLKHVRPDWGVDKMKFKIFTDGISNKLIGAFLEGDKQNMVLIRIFGRNSELLVDRKQEIKTFQVLFKAGIGPELFATFNNGMSYGFMPGIILTTKSVRDDKLFPLIAKEMAKLHNLKPQEGFDLGPFLFPKLKHWLDILPNEFKDSTKNERFKKHNFNLRSELKELEDALIPLESPVVYSHNDILLANIVYDEKQNKISFIDYEYANYNYQAFDIGNHFDEYADVENVDYNLYPDKEYQLKWLREYLTAWHELQNNSEPVTELEVEKLYVSVNKFSLSAHFFWGVWGLLQAHYSVIDFDFLGYSLIRFEEYFKKKDKFLALQMPN